MLRKVKVRKTVNGKEFVQKKWEENSDGKRNGKYEEWSISSKGDVYKSIECYYSLSGNEKEDGITKKWNCTGDLIELCKHKDGDLVMKKVKIKDEKGVYFWNCTEFQDGVVKRKWVEKEMKKWEFIKKYGKINVNWVGVTRVAVDIKDKSTHVSAFGFDQRLLKFTMIKSQESAPPCASQGPPCASQESTPPCASQESTWRWILIGNHKEWHGNGKNLLKECKYSLSGSGELDGAYTKWSYGGKKLLECNYSNGKLEGKYTKWDDGKVIEEGEYKDGEIARDFLKEEEIKDYPLEEELSREEFEQKYGHQHTIGWYMAKKIIVLSVNDSTVNVKSFYKNDQKHSKFTKIKSKGAWVKDGKYKDWHSPSAEGGIWEKSTYKNGKPVGKYEEWYSNSDGGKKHIEYNYSLSGNGEREGKYEKWDGDGKICTRCTYSSSGKLVGKYEEWYKSLWGGHKSLECYYSSSGNGTLDGEYRKWNTDGTLTKECRYNEGEEEPIEREITVEEFTEKYKPLNICWMDWGAKKILVSSVNDSMVNVKSFYKNDQKHAKFTIIKSEGAWVRDGEYEDWHRPLSGGGNWEKSTYKNGQKVGKCEMWWENGNKWEVSNYSSSGSGKLDGKYEKWGETGEKIVDCEYKEGENIKDYPIEKEITIKEFKEKYGDNVRCVWHLVGKIFISIVDDSLVRVKTFYKDEKPYAIFTIKYLSGKWGNYERYEDWYNNGNKWEVINFNLKGRWEGKYERWQENGNKWEISNYKNGDPDGKCEKWWAGKKIFDCEYKNGIKVKDVLVKHEMTVEEFKKKYGDFNLTWGEVDKILIKPNGDSINVNTFYSTGDVLSKFTIKLFDEDSEERAGRESAERESARRESAGRWEKDGKYEWWWPSSKGGGKREESFNKKGKLYGEATTWFEDGQKWSVSNFNSESGKRDGIRTVWFEDGTIETMDEYKNGVRVNNLLVEHEITEKEFVKRYGNVFNFYFIEKKILITFVNDSLIKVKTFYKDGEQPAVIFSIMSKDGKWNLYGKYESWYNNGKKMIVANYNSAGQMEGKYESWYSNGEISKVSNYSSGKYDGRCETWLDDGNIEAMDEYKNGEVVNNLLKEHEITSKEFEERYKNILPFSLMQAKILITFVNSSLIKVKCFYNDGEQPASIFSIMSFLDGKWNLYGKYESWFKNGNKRVVANYNYAGKREGNCEMWRKGGDICSKREYKNGKVVKNLLEHEIYADDFKEKYGDFGFAWENVGKVLIKFDGDFVNVKTFYDEGVPLSKFTIIKCEGERWVQSGKYEHWYNNGRKWSVSNYSSSGSGRLDGLHEGWSEDGILKKKCMYKDGKVVDNYLMSLSEFRKEYNVDIIRGKYLVEKVVLDFKDGSKNALYVELFVKNVIFSKFTIIKIEVENGETSGQGSATRWVMDGKYEEWYIDSDKKYLEKTFKNGKKIGKIIKWYDNGKKWKECNYSSAGDVKKDGEYKRWHGDGTPHIECFYNSSGKKDGEYKLWDSHGKLLEKSEYKDGNLALEKSFTDPPKGVWECVEWYLPCPLEDGYSSLKRTWNEDKNGDVIYDSEKNFDEDGFLITNSSSLELNPKESNSNDSIIQAFLNKYKNESSATFSIEKKERVFTCKISYDNGSMTLMTGDSACLEARLRHFLSVPRV